MTERGWKDFVELTGANAKEATQAITRLTETVLALQSKIEELEERIEDLEGPDDEG